MSNACPINLLILQPPSLDIDTRLGGRIHTVGRIDRRVTWNLLCQLQEAGFTEFQVNDGEDVTPCADPRAVMELAFNLDDCHVYVRRPGASKWYWMRLVFGNEGWDCISDYCATKDEFQWLLDSFDGEDYV